MITTTTRSRRIEAVQYNGVYDGDAHNEIAAALMRWFGRDGQIDEDDMRSFLGMETIRDTKWPVVHTDIGGNGDWPVSWSDWVVYDLEDREVEVWKDEEFRARAAPTDSDPDAEAERRGYRKGIEDAAAACEAVAAPWVRLAEAMGVGEPDGPHAGDLAGLKALTAEECAAGVRALLDAKELTP